MMPPPTPTPTQSYQVSIQAVEAVAGVGVVIWLGFLGANELHDLVLSLPWSLWRGERWWRR